MEEMESNVLNGNKYALVIDSLLLNAWDTGPHSEGHLHAGGDVKGLKRLTAGVNTKCHLPITFCTDSYRLHCKPSASLIACCCWQPQESSTQLAAIWADHCEKIHPTKSISLNPSRNVSFIYDKGVRHNHLKCPYDMYLLFVSLPVLKTDQPTVWIICLGCGGRKLWLHAALLKDIEQWVCRAGRWRRWGDGAWSGWCSTGGCSHTRSQPSLQDKKKKCSHTSNDQVLLLNLIDKAKKSLPLETLDSSKENSPQ